MLSETRAIVFDLDDTLYPYRAFVQSGFKAVASVVARDHGLAASTVFDVLSRTMGQRRSGRELQKLCARYSLPMSIVPALVATIREHEPAIELPCESRGTLAALRSSWRIGVLTNGTPAIQRRKIESLGLANLVDEMVFAEECGAGAGKPDGEAFLTVLNRLGVAPDAAVFVGDDGAADMAGASATGMKAIHLHEHIVADRHDCRRMRCDDHVESLAEIPLAAERLVCGAPSWRRLVRTAGAGR